MVDNTWEMFSTRGRIKMQWMGGYWIDSPYHVCCLMLPFGSPVIVSCVTALCFTVPNMLANLHPISMLIGCNWEEWG